MIASFLLAWRTLVRGRFVPVLFAAVALVAALLPGLIRSDGTASGEREMYINALLGCATTIVSLAVLCAACSHVARARDEHRLALAAVRPVAAFRALVGVWLAYALAAAAVMAAISAYVYFRTPGGAAPCRHHVAPVMPSPMIAARAALAEFLADPNTPDAVRKAPRGAVLSLLASREADRYDSIPPGTRVEWKFPAEWTAKPGIALRVRFATQYEMRTDLKGEFSFGGYSAVISNNTQAILEVPLASAHEGQASARKGQKLRLEGGDSAEGQSGDSAGKSSGAAEVMFTNTGKETVMLRPRRDIFLLVPADSFAANMVRSLVVVLSGIALAAAFGLFLSSALSRPVAVFTALVSAAVIFMVPNVIDQFVDELGTPISDRIGLMLSRSVYALTSSISGATPIADLADDRCVEWSDVARAVLFNVLLLPAAFLGVAAFILRRKAVNGA